MRRTAIGLLGLLFVYITAGAASAVTITLNPSPYNSAVVVEASDSGTLAHVFAYPTTLPDANVLDVMQGASSSSMTYALSNDAFVITMEQMGAAASNSGAGSSAIIYFAVDANVGYTLEGQYALDDADGRHVRQNVFFDDVTGAATSLFRGFQQSESTPDETFTLGLAEGDYANIVEGSLTGTLISGHLYRFDFTNDFANSGTATGPATAIGSYTLSFVPVPEPSTALLVGGGLIALAGAAGKRRPRGGARALELP